VRSLLCAKWNIEKQSVAPLTIYDLMVLMPAALQEEVQALIHLKAGAPEQFMVAVSTGMTAFINTEMAACNEGVGRLQKRIFTSEALDAFFVQTLMRYDHTGNKRQGAAVAGMY